MAKQYSFFAQSSTNRLMRNAIVAAVFVVALLLRRILDPYFGDQAAYVAFFPALVFIEWFSGIGLSAIFVAVSLFAEGYWLAHTSAGASGIGTRWLPVFAVLAGSCIIIAIGEIRRRREVQLQRAQGDLEERVRQRTADLDTANKSLRDLSARLMQLQDEERRRIARELHDSVGQLLVGVTMNLASMRGSLDQLNKLANQLTDSETLVQEMSKEVRTMSHLLHPPLLDEAGLSSALRWYIDGFKERSKIQTELELPSDLERFTPELETAIFRTVQECLTNIHRHSDSPTARVRIANSTDIVRVEVEDRGKGIPPEVQSAMAATGTPGVGIRGMRERVRQLGGTLDITSNGHGTMVVAAFPLAHDPSVAAA